MQSVPHADETRGKTILHRIWYSIFRSPPLPATELDRSQSVANNFFLHIHSAKVHESALRFKTTLGLGMMTFFTFIILVVTGILLMFYYVPTPEQAYDRMLDLRSAVFFGSFLRNLHRWAAHAMVLLALLHMMRVFLTGSHKAPREFNWVLGVMLLLLTLFMSFTGYLLPWDQLAYWAIVVGTAIAGYAPLVGDQVRFILLGDSQVGSEALLRFYVLHVAVLPVILALVIGWHFWRIRKDGGLARAQQESAGVPAPAAASEEPEPAVAEAEADADADADAEDDAAEADAEADEAEAEGKKEAKSEREHAENDDDDADDDDEEEKKEDEKEDRTDDKSGSKEEK